MRRCWVNGDRSHYGDLYVMRADGSDVRQLTDNQFEDATPAWRPEPGTHSASSGR
jgi:Tol biopolymer transport system component